MVDQPQVEHHWLNANRDFQLIREHLRNARAAFFLKPADEVPRGVPDRTVSQNRGYHQNASLVEKW